MVPQTYTTYTKKGLNFKHKQAIQERLGKALLFGFTDIINKIKDKPQSGLMPLTSADLNDF